jgi:hypothetical protein
VEPPLKFFIAGTIQGSRQGTSGVDQAYRATLRKVILDRYPNAIITCPLALLMDRFSNRLDLARADFERETVAEILNANEYGPIVGEIRSAFVELTQLAASADILVAYLPENEASMGTAMEIWSAYLHRRFVIALTPMTQNLSIVATSNIILPSIASFEVFLRDSELSEVLAN